MKNWFLKQFTSIQSKRQIAFFHDLIVITLSWYLAYWLRFNLETIPPAELQEAHEAFFLTFPIHAASFIGMGLYRGIWRFASIPDLVRIFKAIALSGILSVLAIFFIYRLEGIPRSVFPIHAMLLVLLLGGSRFSIRWIRDYGTTFFRKAIGKRTLIVGAGEAGEYLIRDFFRQEQKIYAPILFVDDKPKSVGREIHGVRILGTTKELVTLVKKHRIEQIILAIPSANTKDMQQIVKQCEQTSLPVHTLPKLNDLVSEKVQIQDLKKITIEDLLGRDTFKINWGKIKTLLSNKTILVTGAGGSIGSELSRQIATLKPKKLILLDHSEYQLFTVEQELKKHHPDITLKLHLVSICDQFAIHKIFSQYKIDTVFHAAAYKHVPMLENQLREAVHNNVIGTHNVVETAHKYKVSNFILVSSDKAVNPANVMGLTKRLTEIICEHYNLHSNTNYITVRFGNVLDSAGSVVPIFKEQIKLGGPVRVTHPDVERFFMTIPEASQLILQALTLGNGGEIFALDMGAPIKIHYLAEQMIKLSNKSLKEIKIDYTGLRAGEKMYEELFYQNEQLEKTQHPKINKTTYQQPKTSFNTFSKTLTKLLIACHQYDDKQLQNIIEELTFLLLKKTNR